MNKLSKKQLVDLIEQMEWDVNYHSDKMQKAQFNLDFYKSQLELMSDE